MGPHPRRGEAEKKSPTGDFPPNSAIQYAEAGPADGPPVLLLHGWPYDIHSSVESAPILANAGNRVLILFVGCWLGA